MTQVPSVRFGFRALCLAAIFFLGTGYFVHTLTQHPLLQKQTVENPFGYRILRAIPDSDDHYADSKVLSQLALQGNWPTFADYFNNRPGSPARFHWISHVLFGYSPQSILILNTLFFLLLVTAFYQIAQRLWQNMAVSTAATIALVLWPSALLHFVQPTKDIIFIAGQCLFLFGALVLVSKSKGWSGLLWGTLSAVLGFQIVHAVRPHVAMLDGVPWGLVMVYLLFKTVQSTMQRAPETPIALIKFSVAGLILYSMFSLRVAIPSDGRELYLAPEFTPPSMVAEINRELDTVRPTSYEETFRRSKNVQVRTGTDRRLTMLEKRDALESIKTPTTFLGKVERIVKSISRRLTVYRFEWIQGYPNSSSNLHTDVDFQDDPLKILKFLPTALKVGFLSPYPSMWFEEGRRTGRAGRLIAGAEMCVFYLLLPFAIVALIHHRRRIETWILMAFIFTHVTLLGYVVTNVGALLRMRYISAFLVLLFACEGIRIAWRHFRTPPTQGAELKSASTQPDSHKTPVLQK